MLPDGLRLTFPASKSGVFSEYVLKPMTQFNRRGFQAVDPRVLMVAIPAAPSSVSALAHFATQQLLNMRTRVPSASRSSGVSIEFM